PRRSTTVWVRQPGGWKVAAGQLTPIAQPQANQRLPIVALLGGGAFVDRLVKGMTDIGYIAERDFHLETCPTEGLAQKEARCVAAVVALQPNVIVATTNA